MIRAVLFVATAISLYFVPWPILYTWVLPLPDTVQEQVEQGIDRGFDGIIVYVDRAGSPPEHYAAGWHNREIKRPADPDALFKIASISKLYDVVAVTKLVSAGQLNLDETIATYFPELDGRIQYADRITVRMLVQHRSGIPNFTETADFWIDPPTSREETLDRILDLPANFEPGQAYEYSNTNYLLLAMLIETASGMERFDYIRATILEPNGLHNTFGSIHDIDMDRLMSGYYVGVEEDIKTTDYGSMVATAEDVGRFLRMLNEGTLFDGDEQEIYASLYVYNHTGLIPGYQSIARYHPDIDTVVIQFVNTTNFDGFTWSVSEIIYDRIVSILKNRPNA